MVGNLERILPRDPASGTGSCLRNLPQDVPQTGRGGGGLGEGLPRPGTECQESHQILGVIKGN